ncbi:MAG: Gfo/Idh/MocA family oxidoreductase [Chloroflexi bacterium]|nr:Gfo/Idh/MocA family oxidoreductase [Chloroflexota bacterium]MCY3936887.1 Gfo/Idh/MocA family oxidoreductase [Chloroflexota bacterium]
MSTNSGKPPIRMAQYGTKHAHARGVLSVMLADNEVEVTGVFEPDPEQRIQLEQAGEKPWSEVNWYDDPSEFLDDPTITAVASEGSNAESLDHTDAIIDAGKHAFYDKPAGDDYGRFESIVACAKEKSLLVQMGYMFRYHDGFERILSWANSGVLGHVFSVRAHISTSIPNEYRAALAEFKGGVFYDLAGHVIDLVVYILGRPKEVTSFMQNSDTSGPPIPDNTLSVFEYDAALGFIDIAAMEAPPMARRFEVYGTEGSAIMEPFEPADTLRLCLREPKAGFPAGVSILKLEARPRYVKSLEAFVSDIRGEKQPDRSLDHELLVQETLLRATGRIE